MAPATRPLQPVKHEAVDPVLEKLAETATFDCDWPTLRHHFYLALLAALPLFLELGPPVSLAGRVPVEPAHSTPTRTGPRAGPSGSAGPGGDNPLLSPGRGAGWSEEDGSRGITPPRDETTDATLRPSTQGGLVILPFPPLDTGRRRRSLDQPRVNGAPVAGRGNPFEDEWDEEVIIGGRKLPGWLDEEDGKKEVDKVAQRLEELTFAPFTVQRLAELVIDPTKLHKSLGKFLRAVEKMLNVTTAYTPPSYTYVPPSGFAFDATGSSASPRSSAGSEESSTVPPGSMTPMFSPIPFLIGNHDDVLGDSMLDSNGGHEDSLMSPLMLESSGTFVVQQGDRARSPTPEPEQEPESAARAAAAESKSPTRAETSTASSSNGADPGHQPYMGRVDELDAGPVKSNGHAEDADGDAGMGEGGTMTPHTMSDRPVPISSTTVIADGEREIAPLRRASVSHADAVEVDVAEEKMEDEDGDEDMEKAEEKEGEKTEESDAEMKEEGEGEGEGEAEKNE